MNLVLLATVVAAGISLVVLVVHLTGGTRRAALTDAKAAAERFAIDYPELRPSAVYLTQDRSCAFLELPNSRVGVVHAVGDKFLTRLIARSDLAASPRASAHTVSLQLRDFTWNGGDFVFADVLTAYAVEDLFTALPRRIWEKM
jgi:hypothetical protein